MDLHQHQLIKKIKAKAIHFEYTHLRRNKNKMKTKKVLKEQLFKINIKDKKFRHMMLNDDIKFFSHIEKIRLQTK